jgi:hypothetical protein
MTKDQTNYDVTSEACDRISEAVETLTNLIYESGNEDDMYDVDINKVEDRVLLVLIDELRDSMKFQKRGRENSLSTNLLIRYSVERSTPDDLGIFPEDFPDANMLTIEERIKI